VNAHLDGRRFLFTCVADICRTEAASLVLLCASPMQVTPFQRAKSAKADVQEWKQTALPFEFDRARRGRARAEDKGGCAKTVTTRADAQKLSLLVNS